MKLNKPNVIKILAEINEWYDQREQWYEQNGYDLECPLEFPHEDLDDFLNDKNKFTKENLTIECVERRGGHEGGGDAFWAVIKVTDKDTKEEIHYQIPGYYASYEGTTIEYEDLFKVKPKEVTVIKWVKA